MTTREQRSQAQRDGIKRRADRLADAERRLAPHSAEAQTANRSLGQHRAQVTRAHKLDDAIARTAPKGGAEHDTSHLAATKEHRARAGKKGGAYYIDPGGKKVYVGRKRS